MNIIYKITCSLLLLFSTMVTVQAQDIGTDTYFNEWSQELCERIDAVDKPLQQLGSRGAFMIRVPRGDGGAFFKHSQDFNKTYDGDDNDKLYDGYYNNYISQLCPRFNELQSVYNTEYLSPKVKRKRYILLHDFIRDLQMAKSIDAIKPYFSSISWDYFEKELQKHKATLDKKRWTHSLNIVARHHVVNQYYIFLTDINDKESILEFEIGFNDDGDHLIDGLVIRQYDKNHSINDVPEQEEEVPKGW